MSKSRKPFTGYHMAAILISFFTVVIGVNIYMAKVAIGTFGGTVVDNSYVASQQYNDWLAEADRQARLGWSVSAKRQPGGRIAVDVIDNGAIGQGFAVSARAVHPLGRAPEQRIEFDAQGDGSWLSRAQLPTGRWTLHVEVRRSGERLRMVADV